nr:hypothetical protein [Nitrospinaceae bacterium]
MEYDLSSLLVEVKAEETLPLEARLEREKQRERLGARAGFVAPEYPGQDIPYKFFDLPHVDVSYNTDFDSETNQIRQNYTSLFSGDFLYQTSDVFL